MFFCKLSPPFRTNTRFHIFDSSPNPLNHIRIHVCSHSLPPYRIGPTICASEPSAPETTDAAAPQLAAPFQFHQNEFIIHRIEFSADRSPSPHAASLMQRDAALHIPYSLVCLTIFSSSLRSAASSAAPRLRLSFFRPLTRLSHIRVVS